MVSWVLGSLFAHDGFMFRLLDYCKENSVPCHIEAVYGNMDCAWVGEEGPYADYNKDLFEEIISKYNEFGIGCWLNFTEKDCDFKDKRCRGMLDFISKCSLNKVVVSSKRLANNIKRKYPGVEIISSMTNTLNEVGGIGEMRFEMKNSNICEKSIVLVNERIFSNRSFMLKLFELCSKFKKEGKEKTRNEYKDLVEWVIDKKRKNPLSTSMLDFLDVEELIKRGVKYLYLGSFGLNEVTFMRDIGDFLYRGSKYYLNALVIVQGGVI